MIFLDTSFLISFEVEKDANHEKAVALMEKIVGEEYGEPLISDYIFDETVTVSLVRSKSLRKAAFVADALVSSFQILRVDDSIFERARSLFKAQKRTRLSFTDCSTITLMHKAAIRNIATFDKDFDEVEGINVYHERP